LIYDQIYETSNFVIPSTYLYSGAICDILLYHRFSEGRFLADYLNKSVTDTEEKMAKIFVHFITIICLLILGCAPKLPPLPSTLPALSHTERIHTVENYLPVWGWFRWSEKTLVDRMENYKVPGVSIAVINNDEIEWAKGYGTLEVGSNKSVTPDTLFQSASIGKSLTGTATMHFVEAGYLVLDENVNDKLVSWKVPENEFTKQEKVTLRRLLSHSAGMAVHGFRGYAEGEQIPTLLQMLNGEPPSNNKPIRVDKTPGKEFCYSGGGFQVVQQLFEDVKKEPFSVIMQETVLRPSGMTSSAYELSLPEDRKDRAAVAHKVNGQPAAGNWHHLAAFGAGGGLWTTPTDLARFGIEISKAYKGKSNKIISQQSAETMLTPQTGTGKFGTSVGRLLPGFCSQIKYGLGFILCGEGQDFIFWHVGHNLPGYRSLLVVMPEKEQGIAIMINGEKGIGLLAEIFYSFVQAYGWIRR
jgi:CubicO group peptidase (beta-lactamase class C family)